MKSPSCSATGTWDPIRICCSERRISRAEKHWAQLFAAERDKLEALLKEHVPSGARGDARLLHGEPDDALIQASRTVDLIVVGNREREGLARLLGTVAQRVVRQAQSDVLSLPTASMP